MCFITTAAHPYTHPAPLALMIDKFSQITKSIIFYSIPFYKTKVKTSLFYVDNQCRYYILHVPRNILVYLIQTTMTESIVPLSVKISEFCQAFMDET